MPTRALLPLIPLALWMAFHPLPVLAAPPGSQQPAVVWNVERRDLPPGGWRRRLVVGRDGTVWIGGDAVRSEEGGGLLFRKQGGAWSSSRVLPPETQRTYVLDTDSEGGLWLAPYHPEPDNDHPRSPYRQDLRIQHFDGQRWSEERAPGLWPQAISMSSPEEGWIGGNHGQLLHRKAGRWQLEKLPGEASQLVGKNVMALKMLSSEEGWAAGRFGLIAHWHRGHWQIVPPPPELSSEAFLALDVTEQDGHLWLAGTHGVIACYDGEGWSQIVRPTAFDLLGIDMVSPSDGWAVGGEGILLRYDGTHWSPQPTPVPGSLLQDVVMTSAQEGWIVGDRVLLHGHAETSTRQVPRFQDQSRWAGYSMARKPSYGAAVLDLDGDGDLDLVSQGEGGIDLFFQEGPRHFSESSRFPLLTASRQDAPYLNAWAWGDADGDGAPDAVLLGEPFGLRILRNSGRGTFAAAETLRTEGSPGSFDAVFLLDLDRDGLMDLHLARSQRSPSRIYHNRGGGRFQPSSLGSEGKTWRLGAFWGDLDGDGDLDAILPGKDHLIVLLNDGSGRFREAPGDSGLELPPSWTLTAQGLLVDLDRDGDLDVVLLGSELAAFVNDGKGRFHRDRDLLPVLENNPYAGGFLTVGDLNHDGYPEILVQTVKDYQPTLHLLSQSPGSKAFRDVTNGSGLEGLSGDAAVLADLDGDGDLDLFLARREGSLVLENSQNDTNFLKLHLHGDRSNRAGSGSQVWIYEAGRRGVSFLRGYQQMGVGFPALAQQNLSELHFGVDGSRLYDVEVLFPSGRRVVERGIHTGRTLDIYESPFGIRQGLLSLKWGQRAWLAASLPLEIGKLVFATLALALWRGPLARRLQARLLVPRWSLTAGFLITYLLVAGELAAERRAAPHVLHVLGFCGALTLFAGMDSRLSRWKNQRFFGPFVLENTLGQGGMGVVYRARHAVTGQHVALKVLHPRWSDREDLRFRFLREAQVLTRLEHPNVVRVFETGAVGDRGYISMELLKGMPLSSYVRQEGPLAPAIVIEILLAACDALAHVHAGGLVHGDLKSANLFLLEPGDLASSVAHGWRPRIKLMDFGLAQPIGTEPPTSPASLDGTPAYMSPEQLRGRPLDARSDLYSLGVVAYEALTRQLPFEAGPDGSLLLRIQSGTFVPLRQRRPDVPAALEQLLTRMLALSRADRPRSAEELSALLRALRSGGDSRPLPSSPLLLLSTVPSGEAESSTPGSPASWPNLFQEAKACLAEGRTTEGQILLIECLAALGETLHPMSDEDRAAYCRQHEEIAAALELNRRLSLGRGTKP
ncbi:MAG TPA: FG-GAP-like repeat-containing protein [Thermoanaerobaculia bacterium]|nr:FG-GAP-like repeat-containing protein [Thermoanaerobaculia bacterium]